MKRLGAVESGIEAVAVPLEIVTPRGSQSFASSVLEYSAFTVAPSIIGCESSRFVPVI